MRTDWLFLVLRAYHFLADNSLQSADKDQQESCAVVEKQHNATVKFDTYRNLQRHHAVLPAIAWLLSSTWLGSHPAGKKTIPGSSLCKFPSRPLFITR